MAASFEVIYNYNNLLYKIVDSEDIHNLLDNEYFKQYIDANSNSIEILPHVENEEVLENNGKTVTWDNKTTKLLLQSYYERKELFRDPKQKKKSLWSQISMTFKNHRIYVSEEILDKKFGNLKHHFKVIKDNNKSTKSGQGRITREYFELMDRIFEEDKTINVDEVLSSFSNASQLNQPSTSKYPDSQPSTSKYTDSLPSTSRGQLHIDLEKPEFKKSNSLTDDNCSMETPSKKRNIVEGKRLQTYRQSMFNLEERRLAALEKIAEEMEKNNRIQQERNDLLQKYLDNK